MFTRAEVLAVWLRSLQTRRAVLLWTIQFVLQVILAGVSNRGGVLQDWAYDALVAAVLQDWAYDALVAGVLQDWAYNTLVVNCFGL